MTQPSILVLGATGKTGRRVAAVLRHQGHHVRAASRRSKFHFDWAAPATWHDALAGVEAAYVIAPPTPGLVHDFVTLAQSAGLRRLVLLSGRGADTWGDSSFGLDLRSAEEAVRHSTLEWSIARASNFNQNFDEDLFHPPLVSGELALPAGDVPEPFIDVEDVAEVAATLLTESGHAGRVYELSGPRGLTFQEAIEQIARASGRAITYRQVSREEYVHALVAEGWEAGDAQNLAALFELMAQGLIQETTDDVRAVLGREPRTFEAYVTRAAAAGAWA